MALGTYATTGLNARGLFLELNNGLPSGGSLKYNDRVPAIVNLLAALTDCGSLDELDAFFNTTRTEFSFIVNAADRMRGVSYEWAPFEHRRRDGDAEGLLVSTNHFAHPSWGTVLQDQAGFETVLRRENLLALGHERKGRIDPEVMEEILDIPMNEGGATWPVDGSMPYRTTYQIVAVPASLLLWLKVPGFQEWTGVGLESLFEEKPQRYSHPS